MAQPTPSPPFSIGALEGAAVSFLGGFAGSLASSATIGGGFSGTALEGGIITGIVAFAAYLGYHSYQSS